MPENKFEVSGCPNDTILMGLGFLVDGLVADNSPGIAPILEYEVFRSLPAYEGVYPDITDPGGGGYTACEEMFEYSEGA